eukprot:CAMPEP_0177637192 /NCGR_PEP_ID=MMETSP0447-20121125/4843_1 /TAXON_ID=0 /ORGANISM="Stygamoeba regulata, Strain BSH-02190019" /LENGTH=161 /DNA_ID=CAMNT_0019139109 /DNA_START=376 /DNA_END=857 /DNA_ORIENTATION=+
MAGGLGDILATGCALHPKKQAVEFLKCGKTYEQLARAVDAAASLLSHTFSLMDTAKPQGIKVGFLMHNCIEQVELLLAAARLGIVGVPISWQLSKADLLYIIADADISLLFISKPFETDPQGGGRVPRVQQAAADGVHGRTHRARRGRSGRRCGGGGRDGG